MRNELMSYPATVVSLDLQQAIVRIDATGHVIKFEHDEHNAVPAHLRAVGSKGVIVFPKAPAYFAERGT